MVDILEQVSFQLYEEEKDLMITDNLSCDIVKEINDLLGNVLSEESKEDFTIYHTLGKLKAKKVYVLKYQSLFNVKKRKAMFDQVGKMKNDVLVLIDSFSSSSNEEIITELSEQMMLGQYNLQSFKSKKEEKNIKYHVYGTLECEAYIRKGYILAQAIEHARNLTNSPYNYLNAEALANYAKTLEKYPNVTVKILSKTEIEEMNMGLFLGVNKGSVDEPKLIDIRYQGTETFENPLTLVGKGVMYDTGGYSLKTPQSMPGMKGDMAGSASVISAIEAIARLQVKTNVMAVVAATDNRLGMNAIVPDDILTSANGLTVEIVSTDAEGRLTLADALWYVQKEGAKEVIDVATLTGAMVAALGEEFTGAFTNNDEFYAEFEQITKITKEPIWKMPISEGYHNDIKSKVADISNKGGKYAGASIAAAFLEEFINKDTKWIHLDIAGTAGKDYMATGVMVKSFTEFAISKAK